MTGERQNGKIAMCKTGKYIKGEAMTCVFIVEDDTYISNMLSDLLEQNGYQTIQAFSGTEAMLRLEKTEVDMVLLDLMLPGKTGEEVLDEIRRKSDLPIIALTAASARERKISLLKSGADDYITKPFDNEELLARIEALLRRSHPSISADKASVIRYKDLQINPETREAKVGDELIPLSKHEFDILKLMMENPKRVFTKNNIYETVWGSEFISDDNTISVHISRIRAKLAKARPGEEYIQTVWGIGFKMNT